MEGRQAVAVLDQLRSLSGRLALKLISSPTQRAEALGLALSRMYLEHQGVFSNQIVVPLDAHLELYRAAKKNADELGDEVSFKRTDLALFDLDARARTITCRLIEVKCYNQVGDVGAYNQLKNSIAEQIAQSEDVISYHFDPQRSPIDRPDRLVKTREFSTTARVLPRPRRALSGNDRRSGGGSPLLPSDARRRIPAGLRACGFDLRLRQAGYGAGRA